MKTKVKSKVVVELTIFKFLIIKSFGIINTVKLGRILAKSHPFSVNSTLV